MPSSAVSSLLLPFHEAPFVGEIIGADATATSYVLDCAEGDEACGIQNITITVGPWAAKTLPPGAAKTGEFDMYFAYGGDEHRVELSLRCDMTRSVAERCTTTNIGGNNDGTPIGTLTDSRHLSMYGWNTFSWSPVTITAGQELVAATHAASNKATVTGDTADSTQTASDGATATSSSVTPSAVKDSGTTSCLARVFTAMSVAGVAMSILLS